MCFTEMEEEGVKHVNRCSPRCDCIVRGMCQRYVDRYVLRFDYGYCTLQKWKSMVLNI